MHISDRLRSQRLSTGKTQEQVALDAEMNVTQYNGYERGRSRPAPDTLKRIAKALNTTPEELLGLPDQGAAAGEAPTFDRGESVRRLRAQFREQVAAELGLNPASIAIRIELI